MAKLRYISSQGVEFDMHDFERTKLQKADFHKVSWGTETVKKQYGTTINRFTKNPQTFDCTFKFKGAYSKRKKQIDDFIFQTESDIARMMPGRLYWDEQYIDVYFLSHDTYPEDNGMVYTEMKGQFYAPFPFWIEEQLIVIKPSESSGSEFPEDVKGYPTDRGLHYAYTYSYPYARNIIPFTADSALSSDFKAEIFGPAVTDVEFIINDHLYKVDYPLDSNQVMIIDTRDYIPIKDRCYVLNANGTRTNVFDYRDPTSLLFYKIASGKAWLRYERNHGMNLIIFQERSAPI